MEVLVLDGKEFVKASKAAKELGYASDYVGQLCRSGKITAHLVGRTWYVNTLELSNHKTEKKRNSRVKAREYAKKTIEEFRQKASVEKQNIYKNIDISYEKDDTDLIPKTRKLQVNFQRVENSGIQDSSESPGFVLENKGEVFLNEGNISVVDASEDAEDADAVFLKPKIIKTKKIPLRTAVLEEKHEEIQELPSTKSFVEKLGIENEEISEENSEVIDDVSGESEYFLESSVSKAETQEDIVKSLWLPYLLFSFLVLVSVVTSMMLKLVYIYQSESPFISDFHVVADVQGILTIIVELF